jgi:hypothetical protein
MPEETTTATEETTTSSGDTGKPADTTPQSPPEGYVAQDHVNNLLAAERKTAAEKAKADALAEHFGDLGISDPAKIREMVSNQMKAEDEQKTELEKVKPKLTKAQQEKADAESERDDALALVATLTQERALEKALVEAGVKPERMSAALRQADMDALDIDDNGKVTGIEKAVKGVQKELPEIFNAIGEQPPADRVGMGPGPGDPATIDKDWANMPAAEFEAEIEKAKRGDYVSFT